MNKSQKQRLALVYGTLPSVEEIDQFQLLSQTYDLELIASESICGYLAETCSFEDLTCVALPDHDENPTYLPGLENALKGYDVVIVKERLGVYAYQSLKARWRYGFRLMVWVDNMTAFPAEDIKSMRTIRQEITAAADAFIVQSKGAREALLLEGVPEERVIDLKPWVAQIASRSPQAREEARKVLELQSMHRVIAYTGQIEWEEGLLELLHAVKKLKNETPDFAEDIRVLLYGIGSFSKEVRARAIELGLERQVIHVHPSRQAQQAVFSAADMLYYGAQAARDRIEGDPFRLLVGMAHGLPVLACRTPLVDEYVGKHRLDFVIHGVASLSDSIKKGFSAHNLLKDISNKNLDKINDLENRDLYREKFEAALDYATQSIHPVQISMIDRQIAEVEAKVSSQQYLVAIDLIEEMDKEEDIPPYHRANLYRLIGDCFTKLGDSEAGKDAYMKASEMDPYSYKACIGLGTIDLTQNKYDIAVMHFEKAVALAPNDEMANLGMGLAFQGMGELDEANKWILQALTLNPENTPAIFSCVQLSQERENYTDAINVVQSYLKIHPTDHNMSYSLAGLMYRAHRHEEALTLLKDILKSDPADERAVALQKQVERSLKKVKTSSAG
ncbi:MAG: tetratricopeptide repeat protein [Oligoflexales bacterium]